MRNIGRRSGYVVGITFACAVVLPAQTLRAEPQSPVTITCINLEATAGEGPRYRYVICTPHGCFTTRVLPGGCPAP